MRWLFRILVLALLVGGWTVAAMSLHLVRSTDASSGKDRWFLVPKSRLTFTHTYVDARAWTAADLAAHRTLARRMIDAEKAHAFTHVAPESRRSDPAAVRAFVDDAMSGPTTLPTTMPATPPG